MPPSEDLSADWERALRGDDPEALSRLVRRFTPIVQARVARKLLLFRDGRSGERDVRQEVEDLTQEVFLVLFANDARVLRDWQPERGLSLSNFVGLVAERQALSILRSRRRSPWSSDPVVDEELDADAEAPSPEREAVSRDTLEQLLDRLSAELSPLGRRIFDLLLVDEMPVEEAMAETGLSSDALYAWRSRLRKRARRLLAELSENRAYRQNSLGDARP
jgi:RNA polymerase sigma factor (sigma-70 family)